MANLLELTPVPATGVRATTRSKPGLLELDLDVTPEAVPIVRTIVRAHLTLWGLPGLIGNTTLAVTELLSNVLKHTQPIASTGARSARLTITRLTGVLSVCMRDFNPVLPKLSNEAGDAESGRGLQLVTAFADDCGCSEFTGGKDVWANFLIRSQETSDSSQRRRAS
ncbi:MULTISPECIES: ATP-binding protein [unclassified Streptomyces]|uniref:ATP-binding protein n=1 Tax=unclassified Streptomyces TaxID=2593676 RepID=UPI0033AF7713